MYKALDVASQIWKVLLIFQKPALYFEYKGGLKSFPYMMRPVGSDLSIRIFVLYACRRLEDWSGSLSVLSRCLGECGRLPERLLKDNCAGSTHHMHPVFWNTGVGGLISQRPWA